jgi:hypothetical protein
MKLLKAAAKANQIAGESELCFLYKAIIEALRNKPRRIFDS